ALDAWFGEPLLGRVPQDRDRWLVPAELESQTGEDARRNVRIDASVVEIELAAPVQSTPDAYLRLHLLSHLLVKPNTISLDGIFAHLPIVAWTSAGPMLPEAFARL